MGHVHAELMAQYAEDAREIEFYGGKMSELAATKEKQS